MDTPAIAVEGLVVRYGATAAVDGLSFAVAPGEVFGFVGPNGAGKSTTIRALLDLQRPDAGSVRVLGTEVRAGGGALRARCGYLPGDLALFPFLRGHEVLDLFSALQQRPPTRREAVLDRLGFPRAALGRPVRTYSTGMRQALGLTAAFQHDPEVLVLDEPTTGLDPIVRAGFLDLVRETARAGRPVFLSSHVLDEIEDCADRVGLILRGRLRAVDRVDALRARLPRTVVLRWRDGRIERRTHAGAPRELLATLDLDALADLEIRPADLGEVFRDVVRADEDAGAAGAGSRVPGTGYAETAAPAPATATASAPAVRPSASPPLLLSASLPPPSRRAALSLPLLALLLRRHRLAVGLCALVPILLGVLGGVLYPTFSRERALLEAFRAPMRFFGQGQLDLLSPSGACTLPLQHPLALLVLALAPAIVATALPAGERGRGGLDLLLATRLERGPLVGTVLAAVAGAALAVGLAGYAGAALAAGLAGITAEVPWGLLGLVALNAAALSAAFGAVAVALSVRAADRGAAALGVGAIVAVTLLVDVAARLWRGGEWLRFATPYGAFRPAAVVGAEGHASAALGGIAALLALAAVAGGAAVVAESRRQRA